MEALPAASQAFLEASQSYYASGEEYFKDFQDVQQTLENTESVTERQARIADEQLTAMRSQLEQLGLLNQNVVSLATALANYQAVSGGGAAGGGAAGGGAGVSVSDNESAFLTAAKIVYQSAKGGVSTAQYNAAAAALGIDPSALTQAVGYTGNPEDLRTAYGFSSGGMIQSGQIAKIHSGELIYTGPQAFVANAGQTRRMMGGGDAMLDQLVTLNRNIELLRRDTAAGSVVVATTVEEGNRVLANMASEQERRTA
jgi:hypothetical protein